MDIALPTIPAGILTLLSLIAPYLVAVINSPTWSASVKKLVAVVVSILLAAAVTLFYFVYTGEPVPEWPALVLLAIVVVQASHGLLTRSSAGKVEDATSPRTE